ncbi:MAG: GNAT family N-acetyltransferase [Actinobacteria bacterium]|nr:GNAT family N-acetyltransferase [Actinomycetota bacterium]
MPTAGIVDGYLTRELRRSVLRPHLSAADELPGDDLAGAVHFAVLDPAGNVASTCFICPEPWPRDPDRRPGWHLRQMATRADVRGQGAGAAVLEAVVGYIAPRGGGILWCNARESALGFYARAGFTAEGESFRQRSIPHRRMWRWVAPAG